MNVQELVQTLHSPIEGVEGKAAVFCIVGDENGIASQINGSGKAILSVLCRCICETPLMEEVLREALFILDQYREAGGDE